MKALKNILVKWLLREEAANMERVKTFYEAQEERRAALSVANLVREKLAGFDPALLDHTDDVEVLYPEDGESSTAFFNQIAELKKNTALPLIFQFLLRNQILFGVKEAANFEQLNFSRASVNGVELVREEIERLEALRLERSSPDEKFDKTEVV